MVLRYHNCVVVSISAVPAVDFVTFTWLWEALRPSVRVWTSRLEKIVPIREMKKR